MWRLYVRTTREVHGYAGGKAGGQYLHHFASRDRAETLKVWHAVQYGCREVEAVMVQGDYNKFLTPAVVHAMFSEV